MIHVARVSLPGVIHVARVSLPGAIHVARVGRQRNPGQASRPATTRVSLPLNPSYADEAQFANATPWGPREGVEA